MLNRTRLLDTLRPADVFLQEVHGQHSLCIKHCTMIYMLQGSSCLQWHGATHTAKEGSLLLLSASGTPLLLDSSVCSIVVLSFDISSTAFYKLASKIQFQSVALPLHIQSHVFSALSHAGGQGAFSADAIALEFQILLLFLLRSLADTAGVSAAATHTSDETMMNSILSYIHQNFSQDINFNELCNCNACSSKKMYALFKKYFHMPPIKYLIDYRIQRAKELLQTSQYSVTEIAASCGFQSVHYFSAAFKSATGTSPHIFRQQLAVLNRRDNPTAAQASTCAQAQPGNSATV